MREPRVYCLREIGGSSERVQALCTSHRLRLAAVLGLLSLVCARSAPTRRRHRLHGNFTRPGSPGILRPS